MIYLNINKNNVKNINIKGVNISCTGNNNLLVMDEKSNFQNSLISFSGNNSLVFIDKSKKIIKIKVDIYSNCSLYIGKNIFYNQSPVFIISEHSHCVIGDNCLISFGIFFRTSDAHPIYNIKTFERINFSKSIFIGDSVWIGQNALILKGSIIGSGAIIGANSIVSNKVCLSNSIMAGNPAKCIKNDCAFIPLSCHNAVNSNNDFVKNEDLKKCIFEGNNATMFLIDKELSLSKTAEEKKDIVEDLIYNNHEKNRFSISSQKFFRGGD